jgi:hypothetical protein
MQILRIDLNLLGLLAIEAAKERRAAVDPSK